MSIRPAAGRKFADVLRDKQSRVKPEDHGITAKARLEPGMSSLREAPRRRRGSGFAMLSQRLVGGMGMLVNAPQEPKLSCTRITVGEQIGASPRINLTKRSSRGCTLAFIQLDATHAAKLERAAKG